MRHIALAALMALPTLGVLAEPVYRCGNSYQQTPCPGAKLVDADDPRTRSQWVEAKAVVAEERRLGREMAEERLVSEARALTAPAALSAPMTTNISQLTSTTARRSKAKTPRYVGRPPAGEVAALTARRKTR